MAKYLVLETVRAQGMRPENQEGVTGTFTKGNDIEGTIINEGGFTLISDGVYWQFPVENLFPIDIPEATMPLDDQYNRNVPKNPDRPLPVGDETVKEPIWKHPDMPNWIGAGIGGLLGMKVADKLPVLPGPLNWLFFAGLGIIGGYKGSKYLMGKVKELKETKS